MIFEDECMVLMGTAFWHLTCCMVQGTSELVAALFDWETEIWGKRNCLMISFIISSGLRQITVVYVTEHRSSYFWGTYLTFNSNTLFSKVLSLFYGWEIWVSRTALVQGLWISKWWIPIWTPAWLSHWWMDSVHQNCLECAVWKNEWL